MNQQCPKIATEPASNKACDSCRMHKIRCLPLDIPGSKTCQRCSKTDRECVWSAPQKRKQRKRTDTRVAELEREVSAMKALFDRKGDGDSKAGSSMSTIGENTPVSLVAHTTSNTSTLATSNPAVPSFSKSEEISFSTPSPNQWSPPPYSPDSDVVDRDILSMETASQLFRSYKNDLVQHYPAVVIPSDITAQELRKDKPTLFLAIIAAAAGKSDPYLYSILNSEVLSAYAHRTLIRGEKSLELVQSMIITSIWYYPPGQFAQLKFYEYIHMAAVMALEIGLGRNPKTSRNRRRLDEVVEQDDPESLEKRRAFLACYLVTTGVSMSMRRPNMLRCNDWINECLEVIATNPDITQYDKWLIAWVRLLKINEKFATALSWDESSDVANLSEFRVQIMISGFEKSLEEWRRFHEPESINEALLLQYYHSQLYLHELALHDDHLVEDFRPPYNINKVLSIHIDSKATLSHIDSIAVSISSAHSLLDILLEMDVEVLRALPIPNFVRMAYSFITLIKLYISAKTPASHIGTALNTGTLKLDYYLQAMIDKSMEAVQPKEFRAPFTFLGLLLRYQSWLRSQAGEEVFVAPKTPMLSDCCWLPPVPRFQLEKSTPAQLNTLSHKSSDQIENGISSLQTQFEDVGWDQIPVENVGIELDLDQIMALDGIESLDSNYSWGQDMDLSNGNQIHQGYEWYGHGFANPDT